MRNCSEPNVIQLALRILNGQIFNKWSNHFLRVDKHNRMYVQAAEKKEVFHLKIIDNSTESQISVEELEKTEITDKSAMDNDSDIVALLREEN